MGIMGFISDIFNGGGGGAAPQTTTESTSWSETIQQDLRVTAEDAELVVGAGTVLTSPGSVAVAREASVGDIVIQPYTPEVRQTVSELIETIPTLFESFGEVIGRTSEVSMRATEILGEKLQETQVGPASMLPEVAKYLLIAVVVVVVARKVFK